MIRNKKRHIQLQPQQFSLCCNNASCFEVSLDDFVCIAIILFEKHRVRFRESKQTHISGQLPDLQSGSGWSNGHELTSLVAETTRRRALQTPMTPMRATISATAHCVHRAGRR